MCFIWLTKYFPFSILSSLTWINYENRDLVQASNLIRDTQLSTGMCFNVQRFYKDKYFLYFNGKFEKVIKNTTSETFINHLQKIYGQSNVYLSRFEKGVQLIKINREVALGTKYYDFFHHVK